MRRFSLLAAAPFAFCAGFLVPSPAQAADAPPPPSAAATECGACGKVISIRQSTTKPQSTPRGTGVEAGGTSSLGDAPGPVTSYRIGPGLSNQGMVPPGAAGGTVSKKTPNSYEQRRWEVTVKLESGGTRVVSMPYEPFVHEGDRVRISGNQVELLDE